MLEILGSAALVFGLVAALWWVRKLRAQSPWELLHEAKALPPQPVCTGCFVASRWEASSSDPNTVYQLVWLAHQLLLIPIGNGFVGHQDFVVPPGPLDADAGQALLQRLTPDNALLPRSLVLPYAAISRVEPGTVAGRDGFRIHLDIGELAFQLAGHTKPGEVEDSIRIAMMIPPGGDRKF